MKFYSQNGQDQIIYRNFFKTAQGKGVFLEIGADDGIDNSNTRFFEESLGWTGICVEPRPQAFSQLIKNRKCLCKQAAIGNERKRSSFLSISGYGKGLSGLIDHYDKRHVNRISREMALPAAKDSTAETIEVEVLPIADLLTENSIHHIDICSIDTEGSEFEIVQSIDFSRFHFNVLLIENNYRQNNVHKHLTQQGFKYFGRIGADDIFVNHRFKPLVPKSNLIDFTDGIPYFRFREGKSDSLFVFLSGIPGADHLHSELFFEWRHFAHRRFPDANCLFLRDPANHWYLHPNSKKWGRKKTAVLIESFRKMLRLPKSMVILVGVSAGGTAALDLAATESYGRAVTFSAQLNLKRDAELLEHFGETWRPRYLLAKRVCQSGHSKDLTPVLQATSKKTKLRLVWGGANTVDDEQHRRLMRDLPETDNIHYHAVPTESHNCAGALNDAAIVNLLKDHSSPALDRQAVPIQSQIETAARKNIDYPISRSIETILGDTPDDFRWIGSRKAIQTYLDNADNPLLISFPRTGSHWLRMLMELYFDSPLLTRSFFKHEHNHYLLLHDHDHNLAVTAKHVVYLYRNPIDTVFSQMKYHRENLGDRKRIDFWTDRYIAHLSKWLYHDSFTDRKIVLRYEDLVADPVHVIERLSHFFSLPFDAKRAEQTVRLVNKNLVKSKTSKHDPQVQKLSSDYESKRSNFHQDASQRIWDRIKSHQSHVGMAFGILPEMPKRTEASSKVSSNTLTRCKKIVGLLAIRNESAIIAQCLQSLAMFTDAIVVLDDASEDDTVDIVKRMQPSCAVEKIIQKSHWHRDEPGDRNSLLQAGRNIGGTHFIAIDADEMFTANLLRNHFLRKQILALAPGDKLALVWICLWRSVLQYRYDQSVWTNNYKAFAFADDGKSGYSSEFIHTGRVPNGMQGKTKVLRGYDRGVLHFQFVNWHNLLVKQAWYRCLERIRLPDKSARDINLRYADSKNEERLGLRPVPLKWFLGYDFFNESAYLLPDTWRERQVLNWFRKYGGDHFDDLDIWDIDWDAVAARESKPHATNFSSSGCVPTGIRTGWQKSSPPASEDGKVDLPIDTKEKIKAELERCNDLLVKDPGNTDVLFKIGTLCQRIGRTEDALDFFYNILSLEANHSQARSAIASIGNTTLEFKPMPRHDPSRNQAAPPLVSAIVSTYNAERYIKGCLDDLLSQSISNQIEIIVVDSGSQQNEAAIVKTYQSRHPNIQYIRTEERETVYGAWNRGIKEARGKYITNANTDDRHKRDAFQTMAGILEQQPGIALVYADCLITENENETFEQCSPVGAFKWLDWDREQLLVRGCFMGPQPMWRRSLHDEYGYFDPELVTSGDYEFWLRVSQTNNFFHIPQFLGLYLRSPQSIEHSNREAHANENKKILNLYRKAAKQKNLVKRLIDSDKDTPFIGDFDDSALREESIFLYEKGNYDEALNKLFHILSRHQDDWEAYHLLVDVLVQSGQASAVPKQLQALEERSDLPSYMLALIGSGYEAAGDLAKAADYANQAMSKAPDCAEAWNLKGVLAFRNGDMQMAAQYFHAAIDNDPDWGEPWTNLGTAYWEKGHHNKALDALEKGCSLSPTAPNVATAYHAAVCESVQYERATGLFINIVKRRPYFKKARYLLIDLLIRLERYTDALAEIESLVVRFSPDPQLLEAAKAVRAKVGPMTIKKRKCPSLSLCMIVKNEEKYLPRCLESLKPLVDEMIIVDTGSSDATRDIAEVFGAKVFDYEWNDDFAAARNHSLEQATGDWILVMDADEIITPKDHDSFLELREKRLVGSSEAYVMLTRNYTDRQNDANFVKNTGEYETETGTGWIPSKKVRLFQNHRGIHFVYPVHELVDPILAEMGIPLIESTVPVHHFGKLDRARTSERWQMYYNLGKEKLASQVDNDHALKELAIQSGLLFKWEEATTHWKVYLDRNPGSVDACLNLTRVMAKRLDFGQANQYAQKAFELAANRSETIYNLALSELQTGQAAKAAQTAAQMVAKFPEDTDGRLLRALSEICAGNLDEGSKQAERLAKTVSKEVLLPRVLSIIASVRSAGFDDWVTPLVTVLYEATGLREITYPTRTTPKTKSESRLPSADLPDENPSILFDRANQCYEKEDFHAAFDLLSHIIAIESNHWESYRLLVDVLLQSGQASAIPEQLQALEGLTDLPPYMLALIGSGYETAGDLAKAADYARQAMSKAPHCAQTWNLKGVLAFRNSDVEMAAQHFHTAIEKDPDWGEPWTNLGTVYWEQGHPNRALDALEKGCSLSPTAPNVATAYHAAVCETAHYERAQTLFINIVEGHPDFKKTRYLLIDILIRMERYTDALAQIESLLVHFGTDPQLLEAAKAVRAKVGTVTIKKSKHPSLSLCMIVKNEEKYLPRCLESLKPLVDEMIIVDTGSSDATRDIAEVFGAKVFDFEWNDDFAAARNHSLEQATGDWILVMDADEIIAPKDHKKIHKLLKKSTNGEIAYTITTRNYTRKYNGINWQPNDSGYADEEVGCGWIPSTKTRLFKNTPEIRFEYPVHELVDPALDRNGYKIKQCNVPVHHYGLLEKSKVSQKGGYYYEIGKRKLEKMENDPNAIYELAVGANLQGNQKEAIKLWNRVAELQPNNARVFINLSAAHAKLGNYQKAKSSALNAVKIAPKFKEGHYNLGRSEFFLGNFIEAQQIFKRILRNDETSYSARFMLGATHICCGNIEEGTASFLRLKSLNIWSSLPHAFEALAMPLSENGFEAQAKELIRFSKHLDNLPDDANPVNNDDPDSSRSISDKLSLAS